MSISGKFCTAKNNGVTITGNQSWTGDGSVERLDGTTAEDGGFKHPDSGLQSLSVQMMMVIDVTTGDVTSLQEGTVLTDLGLFADINAADPIYDVPTFLVLKATCKGEVNGRFTFDVSGESVGPYTMNNPN